MKYANLISKLKSFCIRPNELCKCIFWFKLQSVLIWRAMNDEPCTSKPDHSQKQIYEDDNEATLNPYPVCAMYRRSSQLRRIEEVQNSYRLACYIYTVMVSVWSKAYSVAKKQQLAEQPVTSQLMHIVRMIEKKYFKIINTSRQEYNNRH